MNLVMLFNSVLPKLNACQDVAIRHSACRSIPDDNPHCYPGAWNCMQKLMAFVKPTDAEAAEYPMQNVLAGDLSADRAQVIRHLAQVQGHQLGLIDIIGRQQIGRPDKPLPALA